MTDKRRDSRKDDATSMALEAANQALAAANAAVQAAVKALALTRRDNDEQNNRRGRGSIRNAASQARHRLSNRDEDEVSGVAPLASSAPASRATAARRTATRGKPAPKPRAAAIPQSKAAPKPKPAPKPAAAPEPMAAPPPAPAPMPAAQAPVTAPPPPPPTPPAVPSGLSAEQERAHPEPPPEAPRPRGRAGMRKFLDPVIEDLPPRPLPTESLPLSRDNGVFAEPVETAPSVSELAEVAEAPEVDTSEVPEVPEVPEIEATTRPSGAGPIILGSGAPATTEAQRDEAASPPTPAPSEADLVELAHQEAELRQREAELAEREAAMARYAPMEPAHAVPAKPPVEENGYTVLVVDDEEQVRALTVRILSRFGYRVLEASGVELALSILDQDTSNVDLVLSDVAMPGLSGKDLFRAISESRPGLPVVFMSGYALGIYAPEGLIEEGVKMLPKPFDQEDLLEFVTEALQGAAAR